MSTNQFTMALNARKRTGERENISWNNGKRLKTDSRVHHGSAITITRHGSQTQKTITNLRHENHKPKDKLDRDTLKELHGRNKVSKYLALNLDYNNTKSDYDKIKVTATKLEDSVTENSSQQIQLHDEVIEAEMLEAAEITKVQELFQTLLLEKCS